MRRLRLLLCRLIGHRRSARGAFVDPVERRWHSRCRRCGTPMRKHGLHGWEVVEDRP
jgi:hypothetical protein